MKRIFSLSHYRSDNIRVFCSLCSLNGVECCDCDQIKAKHLDILTAFCCSCVREKENEFIRAKHLLPHYGVIQFLKTLISSKASHED